MSMLSAQSDELRKRALELRQGDWSDGREDALLMEDAADTIESLRDRLQPVPAELDYIEDKSRWAAMFGTPERAARTLSPDDMSCKWCLLRDYCDIECLIEEQGKLLEWLRGDA